MVEYVVRAAGQFRCRVDNAPREFVVFATPSVLQRFPIIAALSYRMQNRFHRIEADLQYGGESGSYASPGNEAMFLTHDEWELDIAFGRSRR